MVTEIKIPIYDCVIVIATSNEIDSELDGYQLDLKRDVNVAALTGELNRAEYFSLFVYFDLDMIEDQDINLEMTIDHEVLHLVFYIFDYYNVEIAKGGSNEHFTYFFNYIDKAITDVLTAHKEVC